MSHVVSLFHALWSSKNVLLRFCSSRSNDEEQGVATCLEPFSPKSWDKISGSVNAAGPAVTFLVLLYRRSMWACRAVAWVIQFCCAGKVLRTSHADRFIILRVRVILLLCTPVSYESQQLLGVGFVNRRKNEKSLNLASVTLLAPRLGIGDVAYPQRGLPIVVTGNCVWAIDFWKGWVEVLIV